jgi:hydroxylysine kinase
MDVKDQLIKPGVNIKPQVALEDVNRLLSDLYGIISCEISELNAYDDKNYLVQVDR